VTVPTELLVLMEAVCVDGGCDHDAEAGKELKDARDGEPLSFAEGEELSHKHEDAQDGEYTSKDRAGLNCLEVILWIVCTFRDTGEVPYSTIV